MYDEIINDLKIDILLNDIKRMLIIESTFVIETKDSKLYNIFQLTESVTHNEFVHICHLIKNKLK